MLIICTLTTTIFQLFLCERHFSNLYLVICYAIKIVWPSVVVVIPLLTPLGMEAEIVLPIDDL